jgi:hypothetical protein
MDKDFETQVLTRLAVIESKLDDYKSVREKTEEAFNLATENKQDILEINERIKWITRTIVGAIISGAIGIIFILIQIGIGVK